MLASGVATGLKEMKSFNVELIFITFIYADSLTTPEERPSRRERRHDGI
jgi:hypothetical protein